MNMQAFYKYTAQSPLSFHTSIPCTCTALPFCINAWTCHRVYVHGQCIYQDIHYTYTPKHTQRHMHVICNRYYPQTMRYVCMYTHTYTFLEIFMCIKGIYREKCTNSAVPPVNTCTYILYRIHSCINIVSLPRSLLYTHNLQISPYRYGQYGHT